MWPSSADNLQLSVPLKDDVGLIGFAVSALLLFVVSFVARRLSK